MDIKKLQADLQKADAAVQAAFELYKKIGTRKSKDNLDDARDERDRAVLAIARAKTGQKDPFKKLAKNIDQAVDAGDDVD